MIYSSLQPTVLINLFKSYCCSFYGSPLWKFNSTGFEKCCKAWNIAVRNLLHLPLKTHTWDTRPFNWTRSYKYSAAISQFLFLVGCFQFK